MMPHATCCLNARISSQTQAKAAASVSPPNRTTTRVVFHDVLPSFATLDRSGYRSQADNSRGSHCEHKMRIAMPSNESFG